MLETIYDNLAEKYDTMYKDPVCLAEDKALFDYLTREVPLFKSVLDIGCGTGLLLENLMIASNNYTGIDPSSKSIEIARSKFPLYAKKFNVSKCSDKWFGTKKYGAILSLYGSPSYIGKEFYHNFIDNLDKGGFCIAIFYAEDYSPKYYTEEMTKNVHDNIDYNEIEKVFPYTKKWAGKYIVASNRPLDNLKEPEYENL